MRKKALPLIILFSIALNFSLIAQNSLPYYEDFSSMSHPVGWSATPDSWDWTYSNIGASFPTASNGYVSTSVYSMSIQQYFTSPKINVTGVTNNVQFSYYYSFFPNNNADAFIQVSNDDGLWHNIDTLLTGAVNQFFETDITSYINGSDSIQIRFAIKYINGMGSSTWSFDDIMIREIVPNDLSVTSIFSPISGCDLGASEIIKIKVKNYGTSITSSFPVAYSIDGGTSWVTEIMASAILPDSTKDYTFTTLADFSNVQIYNVKAKTLLASDQVPTNDTISILIEHESGIASFPAITDFETNNDGWFTTNGTTASSWEWGTPSNTIINSAANGSLNAWVTNLDGNTIANENSYVYLPCYNFSSLTLPVIELDINYNCNNQAYGHHSGLILQYSTNSGSTWQTIGSVGSGTNWYTQSEGWFGASNGWKHAKIQEPSLAGQSSVKLRFVLTVIAGMTQSPEEGYAIDNFKISEMPQVDVAITGWETPVENCGMTSTEQVKIKVENIGLQVVTNIPVAYSIDGGVTFKWDTVYSSINPGNYILYPFWQAVDKADFSTPGIYQCVAKTGLATDGDHSNDSYNTQIFSRSSFIGINSDDFETHQYWSSGINEGMVNEWEQGTPIGTVINSAYSGQKVWKTNINGYYSPQSFCYIESPCFDLTGMSYPGIQFSLITDMSAWGAVYASYSIDNGQSWHDVPYIFSGSNWYQNPITSFYDNTVKRTQIDHPLPI